MSFANILVKHAAITIGRCGSQGSAFCLCTLRVQALRVGTGTRCRSLDVLTKDIPITSSSLFGAYLGKALVKATTASRNYKALGDCFVLSGLARPKPPRSLNRKAYCLTALSWGHSGPGTARAKLTKPTGLGRGHVTQDTRARCRPGTWVPTNNLASPTSHSGSAPNRATRPSLSCATTSGRKAPIPDSGPQP